MANTADEAKVKESGQRSKLRRETELDDVRKVLAMDAGRRLIWRLLERAKVFASVWDQSSRIHYNAGQQDFGHFVMGEVVEAGPEYLLQMMQENKEKKSND